MTQEPRHKTYGTPMSEWIALAPGELPRDAVGVWQLVPEGRDGFGLKGNSLIEFVRRSIYALLDAGAVPVSGGMGTDYEWIAQKHYGTTREEIAENVVREWSQAPNDQEILFKVWFARPDPAYPRYVKLD